MLWIGCSYFFSFFLAETVKEILSLNNKEDNSSKKLQNACALILALCEIVLKRECTINVQSTSLVARVPVLLLCTVNFRELC